MAVIRTRREINAQFSVRQHTHLGFLSTDFMVYYTVQQYSTIFEAFYSMLHL
jgi:hypothetical protein